jgi:uroporphyrinogen-III synthase
VHLLAGFTIRKELLYAVKAAQKMPEAAAGALTRGQLDAALFYSPRSASVFRDLVQQERLPVESLTAACISQAAAAALAPLCLRAVRVAARPNQQSLFEVLG